MGKTTKTPREFRVEGHGASILYMFGQVSSSVNPFVRESLLTREGAWSTVKNLMGKDLHTIKVFKNGALVWRAFRQVDGSWVDAATALEVAA